MCQHLYRDGRLLAILSINHTRAVLSHSNSRSRLRAEKLKADKQRIKTIYGCRVLLNQHKQNESIITKADIQREFYSATICHTENNYCKELKISQRSHEVGNYQLQFQRVSEVVFEEMGRVCAWSSIDKPSVTVRYTDRKSLSHDWDIGTLSDCTEDLLCMAASTNSGHVI